MRSYVVLLAGFPKLPPFDPDNPLRAGKLFLIDEEWLPSKLLHWMQIDPLPTAKPVAGGPTATTLVLESFDRFPAARSFAAAAALPAAPPSFFFFFFVFVFVFSVATSSDFEVVPTLLRAAFFNMGSEIACRRVAGVAAF